MDYTDALSNLSSPIEIKPTDTSYFSKLSGGLDPRLFHNGKLIPWGADGASPEPQGAYFGHGVHGSDGMSIKDVT